MNDLLMKNLRMALQDYDAQEETIERLWREVETCNEADAAKAVDEARRLKVAEAFYAATKHVNSADVVKWIDPGASKPPYGYAENHIRAMVRMWEQGRRPLSLREVMALPPTQKVFMRYQNGQDVREDEGMVLKVIGVVVIPLAENRTFLSVQDSRGAFVQVQYADGTISPEDYYHYVEGGRPAVRYGGNTSFEIKR